MKNVLVLFGGASSEHDVSTVSACSVLKHIPAEKYAIYMMGITKEGQWYLYEGDVDALPEDAWLTDVGVDFARPVGIWTLKARLDGYYNILSNKIISAPSPADPWVWLPYNVGKVKAWGNQLTQTGHAVGDAQETIHFCTIVQATGTRKRSISIPESWRTY